MRNSVLCKWLVLPLSVLVVSCSQENESEIIGKRDLVISATQETAKSEDPQTRTVLHDEDGHVWWSPQDRIVVFSGGESVVFTSANNAAAASAQFNGTISIPDPSSSDPYIKAVYPYNANPTFQGGSVTATLPSSQMGVAGTFADDLILLAARSTSPTPSGSSSTVEVPMVFEHLCTGVKFKVSQENITKVKMTATGGEPLAGRVSFSWNNAGNIVISSSVSSPSSSVTVNAPAGGFVPDTWYYIVTLPVQLSLGATFTLTCGDVSGDRVANAFNLDRGVYMSAPALDEGVDFTNSGGGDEPGPDEPDVEVQLAGPDTWVATDELGRSLPIEIEGKRSDGKVLMFYSSWHTGQHGDYTGGIVNITGVQNTLRKLFFDSDDYVTDYWGSRLGYDPCFWGEPLFGYYRTTDPWVLRKHAEMLADAGVDAVFFDCTNGELLWLDAVKVLLETWSAAKNDGVNVPKIAFTLNLFPQLARDTKRALYMLYYGISSPLTHEKDANCSLKGFYGRGEYSDLWFRLEGDDKPLIMAYPGCLDIVNDANDKAIYDFFTWRPGQPDYVYGDSPYSFDNKQFHQWGWLQDYPQTVFNGGEQMTVGVAQNASDYSHGHAYAFNSSGSYGRSYTKAHGNDNLVERTPGVAGNGSYIYGYNFQEQWDYALQKNPRHIMVTQWNEWNAARTDWPAGSAGSDSWNGFSNAFPDHFDSERSRDIEPTCNWGDHGDNYYYQLVQNVRQYKGAGPYPNVTRPKTMEIDGDFTGWDEVSPDFKHYPGNTMHRNHPWQSIYGINNPGTYSYVNNTGRNDFVDARVTRDDEYVYFYVETKENISDFTDDKWMRLLINIDRDATTGWKGYDFCLNYINPSSSSQGFVSVASGENGAWGWSTDDSATFDYAVNGNKMELRVPRSLLGLNSTDKLDFEFKWCDNNLVTSGLVTRILNLYVDGDAAPGGRFNFHYKEPVE